MFRGKAKQIGPLNYSSALDELGGRSFKKIYNNTYLNHENDGSVSLIFHETKIIIYHPDGSISLSYGGVFKTKMTQSRLNSYLENINILTIEYDWVINSGGDFFYEFEDNMTVSSDGYISTCPVGRYYIEEKTGKEINSLEDMITVLKKCDQTTLKKLWRKHLVRLYIAYYAPLDFLALVASSATGEVKNAIQRRFEEGK